MQLTGFPYCHLSGMLFWQPRMHNNHNVGYCEECTVCVCARVFVFEMRSACTFMTK